MTRLAHLSDLHFGAHDARLVEAVEARIDQEKPDLVVISGDFTQRARTDQFEEACAFLTRLRDAGHEVLGVPGNHDVPLYDVLRRFLSPLTRYKRFIDDDLCPFHELPGAAVLGINTARSLTFKDGRINADQVDHIRTTFTRSPDVPRVLVTHHPLFALPVSDGPELGKALGRQDMALDVIEEMGIDLLLAGHNHRASTHHAADFVTRAAGTLVVQAGTATSTRLRDEEQSFNMIEFAHGDDVTVIVQAWDGSGYAARDSQRYRRLDGKWSKADGVTPPTEGVA